MKKHFGFISILIFLIMIISLFLPNVYAVDITAHNTSVLNKVKALQDLAQNYIDTNGLSLTATELTLQFMRKDRYNDTKWTMLLGEVDQNFVTAVGTQVSFDTNEVFYDITTGKEIDFIHMAAALSAYNKYGNSIPLGGAYMFVSTDYAGWGGDLLTFAKEIETYSVSNPSLSFEDLLYYSISLLGTNKTDENGNNTFSDEDILADLDALNIHRGGSNNNYASDLYTALTNYYMNNSTSYNSNTRVASSRLELGTTSENIITSATSILSNTLAQSVLISSTLSNQTIQVVAQAFSNYILENPYMELESYSSDTVVGNSNTRVKIYESNSNPRTEDITITPNIATAKIDGEYLVITPKQAGEAIVTVYSRNKAFYSIYTLNITNVRPAITKDLETSYDVTENASSKILITASGTNNIYTWYISDSENGPFTKIDGQTSNSMSPTLSMNNKYVKCGIKNEGNEEIFSKVTKLSVKAAPPQNTNTNTNTNKDNNTTGNTNTSKNTNTSDVAKKDPSKLSAAEKATSAAPTSNGAIVNTGDSTLVIAITIIVFVLVSNIIVFAVERKNKKDINVENDK